MESLLAIGTMVDCAVAWGLTMSKPTTSIGAAIHELRHCACLSRF